MVDVKVIPRQTPKLSLCSVNATALMVMEAVNRENSEHCIPSDHKPPEVVALKGQKKVAYQASGNTSQVSVL